MANDIAQNLQAGFGLALQMRQLEQQREALDLKKQEAANAQAAFATRSLTKLALAPKAALPEVRKEVEMQLAQVGMPIPKATIDFLMSDENRTKMQSSLALLSGMPDNERTQTFFQSIYPILAEADFVKLSGGLENLSRARAAQLQAQAASLKTSKETQTEKFKTASARSEVMQKAVETVNKTGGQVYTTVIDAMNMLKELAAKPETRNSPAARDAARSAWALLTNPRTGAIAEGEAQRLNNATQGAVLQFAQKLQSLWSGELNDTGWRDLVRTGTKVANISARELESKIAAQKPNLDLAEIPFSELRSQFPSLMRDTPKKKTESPPATQQDALIKMGQQLRKAGKTDEEIRAELIKAVRSQNTAGAE